MNKKIILGVLVGLLVVGVGIWVYVANTFNEPRNFAECFSAKNSQTLLTSPEQCVWRGKTFINTITSLEDSEEPVVPATIDKSPLGESEVNDSGASTKTFTSKDYNFKVSYPANLVAESYPFKVFFLEEVEKAESQVASLAYSDAYDGYNFNSYVYLDFEPVRTTTVAGQKAKVFEAPNGYCDGPGCSDPFIAYAFDKGGILYVFRFDGDIKLSADEKKMLDSFTFLE